MSAGVTTGELAAWMDDAGAVSPSFFWCHLSMLRLLDTCKGIVLCSLSCFLERGSTSASDQAACCVCSSASTEAWVCTRAVCRDTRGSLQAPQPILQAAIGYTGLSTDAIINTVRYGGLLGMLCHVRCNCKTASIISCFEAAGVDPPCSVWVLLILRYMSQAASCSCRGVS